MKDIESENYIVSFNQYTERHYIKDIEKKYKNAWLLTLDAIENECRRIDNLIGENNHLEIIINYESIKIIKMDFKIAGTKESRKSSGHRCILAMDDKNKKVEILLIYHKSNIIGKETAWWKEKIRKNIEGFDFINL